MGLYDVHHLLVSMSIHESILCLKVTQNSVTQYLDTDILYIQGGPKKLLENLWHHNFATVRHRVM